MGTPNKSSPTAALDPETKLKLITGALTVPNEEITPEEWHIIIVFGAIQPCKPFLKYLSRFRSIEAYLEDERRSQVIYPEIVTLPEGVKGEAQCAPIFSFPTDFDPLGQESRLAIQRRLFLTRDGRWLLWYFRFEIGPINQGKECRFSLLEKDGFIELFKQNPGLGKKILEKLFLWVREGIREREERLAKLRALESSLCLMHSRIE